VRFASSNGLGYPTFVVRRMMVLFVVLLCASPICFGSNPTNPANRSWSGFERKFLYVVNRRDKEGLLKLTPSDFFDGGGGDTAREWLGEMENERVQRFGARKSIWTILAKSIRKTYQKRDRVGMIYRQTRDDKFYFEYGPHRGWCFAGCVGD